MRTLRAPELNGPVPCAAAGDSPSGGASALRQAANCKNGYPPVLARTLTHRRTRRRNAPAPLRRAGPVARRLARGFVPMPRAPQR
jgi:hypothetical protein